MDRTIRLVETVSQVGKPLTFYSRKLASAQKNYIEMDQDLLSIMDTLKEFRTMLLGQRITVHTDHKNRFCTDFSAGHALALHH